MSGVGCALVIAVTGLIVIVAMSRTESFTADATRSFSDTLPEWAQESIIALHQRGIIQGYSDGRFGSEDSLTRGQIITLLYRILRGNGFIDPPRGCPQVYRDVPVDHYAFTAVCVFRAQGWLPGEGDFHADEKATRSMAAAFIRGVFHSVLESAPGADMPSASSFRDVPLNHTYAEDVAFASRLRLMTGYPDGRFGPEDPLTRAQAATVLHRLIMTLETRGVEELSGYNPDTRMEGAPAAQPVARLEIPKGALPPGVKSEDVSVRSIANGGWELRPDGLALQAPLELVLTIPTPSLIIPILYHQARDGSVEVLSDIDVSYDAESSLETVRASLTHFSSVYIYAGSITIEAPHELGTHYIGDSFKYPIYITAVAPEVVRDNYIVDFTLIRSGVLSDGVYVANNVVTPERHYYVPVKFTVRHDDPFAANVTFTCVNKGLAFMAYTVALTAKLEGTKKISFAPRFTGVDFEPQEVSMMITRTAGAECKGQPKSAAPFITGRNEPDGNAPAGDGVCPKPALDCQAIKRDCDYTEMLLEQRTKECDARWEDACDADLEKLINSLRSCMKRYEACLVRTKYKECVKKYAGSSSTSSSEASADIPIATPPSHDVDEQCKGVLDECDELERQYKDIEEQIRALREICAEETINKKVCLDALATNENKLASLAKELDRCRKRFKYQDCKKYGTVGGAANASAPWRSEPAPGHPLIDVDGASDGTGTSGERTSASSVRSIPSSSSTVSSVAQLSLGMWEFLDIDRDWQRTDTLPFGHRVHLIVARDPQRDLSFDVRQYLPISLMLFVNGAPVWEGRVEGDANSVCRDATGCSIDGPLMSSSWQGKSLELIAVGRTGELLARHRQ